MRLRGKLPPWHLRERCTQRDPAELRFPGAAVGRLNDNSDERLEVECGLAWHCEKPRGCSVSGPWKFYEFYLQEFPQILTVKSQERCPRLCQEEGERNPCENALQANSSVLECGLHSDLLPKSTVWKMEESDLTSAISAGWSSSASPVEGQVDSMYIEDDVMKMSLYLCDFFPPKHRTPV